MHGGTWFLHDSPIRIRNAGVHQAKQGEDFHFHRDEFWELMYVREGYLECQQETNRYPLHAGMTILHPPRALHGDFALGGYRTYYIWLDLPHDSIAKNWTRVSYDDETHQLERLCSAIVREWNQYYKYRDAVSKRMLSLLAEQLTIVLERSARTSEHSVGEQMLHAAERIMEAEYHQPLSVADIARRLNMSESGLYAHFASLRGQSPMGVLQAIRLRHALGYLHHSTRTLDTIAALCGYCSASHLTKHVKAATGNTPGRLRAIYNSSEPSPNQSNDLAPRASPNTPI